MTIHNHNDLSEWRKLRKKLNLQDKLHVYDVTAVKKAVVLSCELSKKTLDPQLELSQSLYQNRCFHSTLLSLVSSTSLHTKITFWGVFVNFTQSKSFYSRFFFKAVFKRGWLLFDCSSYWRLHLYSQKNRQKTNKSEATFLIHNSMFKTEHSWLLDTFESKTIAKTLVGNSLILRWAAFAGVILRVIFNGGF